MVLMVFRPQGLLTPEAPREKEEADAAAVVGPEPEVRA
jgi:hypothetical protein